MTAKQQCGICGLDPAAGLASITTVTNGIEAEVRYCHGDNIYEPSCYMAAQWILDDTTWSR